MKKLTLLAMASLMAMSGMAGEDSENVEMNNFIGGVYDGEGSFAKCGNVAVGSGGAIIKSGNVYFTPKGVYIQAGDTYLHGSDVAVKCGDSFVSNYGFVAKAKDVYVGSRTAIVASSMILRSPLSSK